MADFDAHAQDLDERDRMYREGCAEYNRTDPVARAYAVTKCDMCDDDGYRGTRVCDHQEHSTAAGRAAAMAMFRDRKGGAA